MLSKAGAGATSEGGEDVETVTMEPEGEGASALPLLGERVVGE